MGSTGEELTEAAGGQEDQTAVDLFGPRPRPPADAGARKRAAVEMIARHDRALRNTARRYSLCMDDANDAYQRTLEIVLTKAPTENPRELIRWTHTVMKHEALAVRRNRERLLGAAPSPTGEDEGLDWITLIPAGEDGPDVRVERSERIARSREALQTLKPAELRALTLLGEGYSYAEISEITGFSRTKVNRCLAEGRERFRRVVSHTEDGSRCKEMLALLSVFCDGEAAPRDAAAVREHLRACASCRAAMRDYRSAPKAAAALAPILPLSHSLLDPLREAISRLHSHLPGRATAGHTVASGGSGGSSVALAGVAKVAIVLAAAAGGGVATGVIPNPLEGAASQLKAPAIERVSPRIGKQAPLEKDRPKPRAPRRSKQASGNGPIAAGPDPQREEVTAPVEEAAPAPVAEIPVEATEAPVEYSAPPESPTPATTSEPSSPSSSGAAGEFGP